MGAIGYKISGEKMPKSSGSISLAEKNIDVRQGKKDYKSPAGNVMSVLEAAAQLQR